MDTLDAFPPLIRHQNLRKRGSPSPGYTSGRLSASAIHSVARRSVSASAYVSARPTRSVSHHAAQTHGLPILLPVAISATVSTERTSVLAPSTKAYMDAPTEPSPGTGTGEIQQTRT